LTLPEEFIKADPEWCAGEGPAHEVVVTSRARYARNILGHQFSPHSNGAVLKKVCDHVDEALGGSDYFSNHLHFQLSELEARERLFLKERRLVSKELEANNENRGVYIDESMKGSVMVNEEDHLRIQTIRPGFQIEAAFEDLGETEKQLGALINFAFHQKYGYLTACPTNVGTGLRASVMLHLPALVLRRQVESALQILPAQGLTVRGFWGENSDHSGDFFQVSNEVTLGLSPEEIIKRLREATTELVEQETEARSLLLNENDTSFQDAVWRSYGILANARKISSSEAIRLMSRLRLGIDANLFHQLNHRTLNQLMVEIQPGHLILRHGAEMANENRDALRAELIRRWLHDNET